jgi:hypothetical protein
MSETELLEDDIPTLELDRDFTAVDKKPCWARFERENTKAYPLGWNIVKQYTVTRAGLRADALPEVANRPSPPRPPPIPKRRLRVAGEDASTRPHWSSPNEVAVQRPLPNLSKPRDPFPTLKVTAPSFNGRIDTIEQIPMVRSVSQWRSVWSAGLGLATGILAPALFGAGLVSIAVLLPGLTVEASLCAAIGLSGCLAAAAAKSSMRARGLRGGRGYALILLFCVLWGVGLAWAVRALAPISSLVNLSPSSLALELFENASAPLAAVAIVELLLAALIALDREHNRHRPV